MRPRVLDPSCGEGAFLIPAARRLIAQVPVDRRAEVLLASLSGWDVDVEAVAAARHAIAAAASLPERDVAACLVVGDALGPVPPSPGRWDLIVGNPPWVDASRMVADDPARRAELAGRFEVCAGNWDLWCPFVERALSLLAPGGIHGFIVPRQLLAAPYARATRRRLEAAGVVSLVDLGPAHGFPADVYPVAYVAGRPGRAVGTDGAPWGEPKWMTLPGTPLGELAEVRGAATVAEAYALDPLLTDRATVEHGDLRMLNSGTIDPGRSLWGQRPMRYLKRRWLHPVVPAVAAASLGARRLAQARSPKLVVASMTRRLEVFRDVSGGWLPGKSTSIVLASDDDLPWIAAWLDAPVTQAAWKGRYGALAMAGGHLRVGPPQLRDFPVPPLDRRARAELTETWLEIEACSSDGALRELRARSDRHVRAAWSLLG